MCIVYENFYSRWSVYSGSLHLTSTLETLRREINIIPVTIQVEV